MTTRVNPYLYDDEVRAEEARREMWRRRRVSHRQRRLLLKLRRDLHNVLAMAGGEQRGYRI